MPKQTYGGDDDTEYVEEKEARPKLERFSLQPDKNARDLFWKVIEAKAGKREPSKEDAAQARAHRFVFVGIYLSLLKGKGPTMYGVSRRSLSRYVMEFLMDVDAEDALLVVLAEALNEERLADTIAAVLKQTIKKGRYRQKIFEFFKRSMRKAADYPVVLSYLPKITGRRLEGGTADIRAGRYG